MDTYRNDEGRRNAFLKQQGYFLPQPDVQKDNENLDLGEGSVMSNSGIPATSPRIIDGLSVGTPIHSPRKPTAPKVRSLQLIYYIYQFIV